MVPDASGRRSSLRTFGKRSTRRLGRSFVPPAGRTPFAFSIVATLRPDTRSDIYLIACPTLTSENSTRRDAAATDSSPFTRHVYWLPPISAVSVTKRVNLLGIAQRESVINTSQPSWNTVAPITPFHSRAYNPRVIAETGSPLTQNLIAAKKQNIVRDRYFWKCWAQALYKNNVNVVLGHVEKSLVQGKHSENSAMGQK